jgi:hypothetical protein
MSDSLNKVETLGGGSMISIEGLSKKQMAMLDIIWSCQSNEQFLEWYLSLSEQEYLEMAVRENPLEDVQQLLKRISHGPSTEA